MNAKINKITANKNICIELLGRQTGMMVIASRSIPLPFNVANLQIFRFSLIDIRFRFNYNVFFFLFFFVGRLALLYVFVLCIINCTSIMYLYYEMEIRVIGNAFWTWTEDVPPLITNVARPNRLTNCRSDDDDVT